MIYQTKKICCLSFFLILIFPVFLSAQNMNSKLSGSWESRTYNGTVSLVFQSGNILIYNGERANYKLVPGAIRVQDGYDFVDYPYSVKRNTLFVTYPDGSQIKFTRLKSAYSSRKQPQRKKRNQKTVSSGKEISDPSWGYKFSLPRGWKYKKTPQGAILGHDKIAGMILVYPHQFNSLQQLNMEMQKGLSEEGIQLSLSGRLRSAGKNALTGEYTGYASGSQARTKTFGTWSPHGGGAIISAITTPQKFGKSLKVAANHVFKTLRYFKTNKTDLMRHFAGKWVNHTRNSTTRMFLHPNGIYSEDSETGYSGTYGDGTGVQTGNWNAYGQNAGQGRWRIRGNKRSGTLIIQYNNGKEWYGEYQVHVEKGYTYWTEYFFNGSLYSKE